MTKIVVVQMECPICKKEHSVNITEDEYYKYCEEYVGERKCIQTVFPHWSKVKREKFITQMCNKCQKDIF